MKNMSCMLARWFLVSNKVEMELVGVDELLKQLEQLGRKGSSIENKALKQAGELMASEMRKEAPVDTGALRDSIEVSNIKTKKGRKRVEVGPTEYYSTFIEKGTSKMPANPFMARSYEAEKKNLQNIIISEIKKGLGLK